MQTALMIPATDCMSTIRGISYRVLTKALILQNYSTKALEIHPKILWLLNKASFTTDEQSTQRLPQFQT